MTSSHSQFGHTFDAWGHHLEVGNSNHIYQEVIEETYLRRNPDLLISDATENLSDHGRNAEVFPITRNPEHQLLTDVGVITSACGLTTYLGRAPGFLSADGRRNAYQAIATAYMQCDPAFQLDKPMFALAEGPAQFVFDRGQSHGQAGLLALVASAAANLPADWMNQAEAQLQRIVHPGPIRWRKAIVEKQASYACVPELARPANRTPHPRIFLAGDYTAGAYPATLESATLSGVQSAHALLEQL